MSIGDIACSPSLYHLEFLGFSLGIRSPCCTGIFYNSLKYVCCLMANPMLMFVCFCLFFLCVFFCLLFLFCFVFLKANGSVGTIVIDVPVPS